MPRRATSETKKRQYQFMVDGERMREEGLIRENPFQRVKETAVVDQKRNVYVPREVVFEAMEAAPDAEWRLIIALSRFGGFRCPTEVLSLTWKNVLWSEKKIIVVSPKTERHQNGAQRVIPMFPELVQPLEECFEQAREGALYCIERHRPKAADNLEWHRCNLGELLKDILVKGGIPRWPKIFHGMRASCETDLSEKFPIQVVTAWMGNTVQVAQKHYLRILPEHFERAVTETEPTKKSGANSGAATARTGQKRAESPKTEKAVSTIDYGHLRQNTINEKDSKYPRLDSNQ